MAETLKITLPLYEGPMDLLLDLIRKQKIDVYDIPIADVTRQYLEFLHLLEEIDVEAAAEFLPMAAQLIYIKSRMLLPPDPTADEDEEDPRTELVRRLLEYEKFKNAAEMLYQRELVEKAGWSSPGRLDLDAADLEPEVTATLFDLLVVFRDVLQRLEERPALDVTREEFTVEQMAGYLMAELGRSSTSVEFRRLMEGFQTRRALITAFLALLELVRVGAVRVAQEGLFGDIFLKANSQNERAKSFSVA